MIAAQLARDPELKRELDLIALALKPLAADRGHCDPPPELAERTCAFVVRHVETRRAPAPAPVLPSRWSLTDLVVAAGIFFAAAMLFFPAVNQSQFTARVTSCQNNLRQMGIALDSYSTMYNGLFPPASHRGGWVAEPSLVAHGLLGKSHLVLVCPASELAGRATQFRMITADELPQAKSALEASALHEQLAGSYGYTLGYMSPDGYHPTKNMRRARFALMADAPHTEAPFRSLNHGGCGQNVLFEDGHVQYLTTCRAHGCKDDIFTNDEGKIAPGLHANDSVIGPSSFKLLVPVRARLVPAAAKEGSR